MKTKTKTVAGLIVLAFFLLGGASSCDTPNRDRSNRNADGYHEASNVQVWLNADEVPTLVRFCADGLAWASTLSSDGAKTPVILRVPERDGVCQS